MKCDGDDLWRGKSRGHRKQGNARGTQGNARERKGTQGNSRERKGTRSNKERSHHPRVETEADDTHHLSDDTEFGTVSTPYSTPTVTARRKSLTSAG
jgi:hypothetical protein